MGADVQGELRLGRERHRAAVAVERLVRHVRPSGDSDKSYLLPLSSTNFYSMKTIENIYLDFVDTIVEYGERNFHNKVFLFL